MVPTVGRIVHYFPSGPDDPAGANGNALGPVAAIITRVWGPAVVNLTCFADYALQPMVKATVPQRGSPGDHDGGKGTWDWPARTES